MVCEDGGGTSPSLKRVPVRGCKCRHEEGLVREGGNVLFFVGKARQGAKSLKYKGDCDIMTDLTLSFSDCRRHLLTRPMPLE